MTVTDWRKFLLSDRPNACFITLATLLSATSLSLTPSAIPSILNLATLLVYSRILLPRPGTFGYASLLLTGLTVGGTIPKLAASLSALSSPGISVLVLFVASGVISSISICAVLLDAKICLHFPSPWTQITLFPALWASLWSIVAHVSPMGRLAIWSPTQGIKAYAWLTPLLGPAAIDWTVAAWAVVLSQAFAAWFMSESFFDESESVHQHTTQKTGQTRSAIHLAVLLSVLAIPSLFFTNYTLPVVASHDITPLSVGCVLPPYQRYKHHSLTLDDYIKESKTLTMSSKVLLWPESAVVFHNESEREAAFTEIREKVTGSYVGVSFEETFPYPGDKTATKGARRNGIALISHASKEAHLVYYKRKLVPIAESFSLTHSEAPPEMYTMDLPKPSDMNKTDWASGPNHTRPITVTTSICLDFTAPELFTDLPVRPSLILAPARTWDINIGIAMWNQAKQRANELGTMVLWCDGGDGGVSGIAGQGYNDIQQVGPGSWFRTIGIDYPHQDSRTIFAVTGSYAALLLLWFIALGTLVSGHAIHFLPGGTTINKVRASVMSTIRRPKSDRILLEAGEEPPLLDL